MTDPDPERGSDAAPTVRDADDAGTDESLVDAQLGEGLSFERPPIEPERPDPENALFVVVGALGTVALLASAFAPGLV